MSERAEGCGQWLSAKTKRTATQLAPFVGGKSKKKKGLLNFASRVERRGTLNIHVSCSPLSPRTSKNLKNAKQTKLDSYFKGKPVTNVSACDNSVASKREGLLGEKRTKVPIKRHRERSFTGNNTKDNQSNQQLLCSEEEEISDTTDFNISGISHLDDSFDNSVEVIKNDLHQESNIRDSLDSPTLSPPNKKVRTSESRPSMMEVKRTESNKFLTAENEPSQSFHFTQWKRDQIAKCKKIQDEEFIENGPCSVASSFTSVEEESDLALDQGSVGVAETPPFQFTQWAIQQVEECRRIQKETNISDHQLLNSKEQSIKLKLGSREREKAQSLTYHSDSEFDFSESAKNQLPTCHNSAEAENSAEWECEKWSEWVYKTGKNASTTQFSRGSEFQFSEWVKSQLRQCRVTQEDNQEGL